MFKIGPTFHQELVDAGLGDIPLSWSPETGELNFGSVWISETDPETGAQTSYESTVVSPEDQAAIQAVLAAHDPTKQLPPVVPESVSKLGLIRALRAEGTWPTVKAMIAADEERQEDWDAAQSINRSDPLTQGMIAALKMTDEQVDQLMLAAQAIAT